MEDILKSAINLYPAKSSLGVGFIMIDLWVKVWSEPLISLILLIAQMTFGEY